MNSLGLAPCPNHKCGSSDCLVLQVQDRFWAFCTVCNCDGPNAESVEAAKAAWDALPRMSTIIAWQFQAAGLALENQSLRKMVDWLADKMQTASKESCSLTHVCPGGQFNECHASYNCSTCWAEAARRAVEGK